MTTSFEQTHQLLDGRVILSEAFYPAKVNDSYWSRLVNNSGIGLPFLPSLFQLVPLSKGSQMIQCPDIRSWKKHLGLSEPFMTKKVWQRICEHVIRWSYDMHHHIEAASLIELWKDIRRHSWCQVGGRHSVRRWCCPLRIKSKAIL